MVRGPLAGNFEGYNPKKEMLTAFDRNTAHSNNDVGFRTYPQYVTVLPFASEANFFVFVVATSPMTKQSSPGSDRLETELTGCFFMLRKT